MARAAARSRQDKGPAAGRPGAGQAVRSVLQAAIMIGSLPLWGVAALLAAPFRYPVRYAVLSSWGRFNIAVLERLCRMPCELEGGEHIPATPGVVMAKHQSVWETLALLRWFHPQTWVLKRELLRLPVFGWGLGLLEPIAIDRGARGAARAQVIAQGRERLASGRWVVVYPEGTRIPPGRRGRYRTGGAELAIAAGRPVVPVAHNAGERWPRRTLIKRPGPVRVRIGPPIEPGGHTPESLTAAVESWIEAQMPELYDSPYSGELYVRPAR